MKCLMKIIGLLVLVASISAAVAYYMSNYYIKRHTVSVDSFDDEESF